MKRAFIIVILLASSIYTAKSQSYELGICGGVSFYMGDLNPKGVFSGSRPAGGVLFRYNINPRIAFKATALFGSLEASDAKTGDIVRNLSFRSPISEISAQIELNFLKLYNEKGLNPFSPYIFVGVGVFSFNPQAKYNDTWYDLQALGTEGQELYQEDKDLHLVYDQKRYSLTNFSIPFGVGMRYNFLKYYSIGLEWGFRKTFTDYIDDVSGDYVNRTLFIQARSQLIADLSDRTTVLTEGGMPDYHKAGSARGNNANTKDWYSFAVLTFSFRLENATSCHGSKPGTTTRSKTKKKKPAF